VTELLPFKTIVGQKEFFYTLKIGGRSPRQIADSLAIIEKNRLDRIAANSLATKFIVHYGFNKSTLIAKENKVLDSLLIKLSTMPKVNIAIGAFTDCIGSYKYNYRLSVKRAKTVVAYLLKHGLEKNRIITNGYSKKYNITPCSTKYAKRNRNLQQNNRRAEIVLTENRNANWESLEKSRGAAYYKVYDAKSQSLIGNLIKPVAPASINVNEVTKQNNKVNNVNVPAIVKAVKLVTEQKKSLEIKKPPLLNNKPDVINKVKVDTIKTNTTAVKLFNDTINKKPTLAKITSTKTILPKTSVVNKTPDNQKIKPIVKIIDSPKVIIATASVVKDEDDLTKEDIIKALDSLAKLKREQERIVEYLTKRINKKPIDVYVSSDSVSVEIYDNGIHDKDSVSVIYNNRIIVDRKELKVNNPIRFKLKVDKNKKNNELVLVAENLGVEPPNTAVMFITEKSGRRQQVMLSTDMTHNEVIYFIRIAKE
jgi:outer membrane protein OmpA-like peptidoglycan-associated protein